MTVQRVRALAIGASAGGIEALMQLLPGLPASLQVPVFVVIHLPPGKPSLLVNIFSARCAVTVCEAEDKQPIEPGTIYFAPPDYHLLVDRGPRLALSCDPPVLWSRPSIDVLLESAADAYGHGLMAIVLTGASHDGGTGLAAVVGAGGVAVVQEPSCALVPTMPQHAISCCPDAAILSLDQMASMLLTRLGAETAI